MALRPIFRVARSSRADLRMLVARALKIDHIADGGNGAFHPVQEPAVPNCSRSRKRFFVISSIAEMWTSGAAERRTVNDDALGRSQ
jgi:hypothetical protein